MTTSSIISSHRSPVNLYVSAMCYNILTLTDGAIRMIVLLFFVQLKFSALAVSIMFSLYELMGVVTNLYGGLLGSWYGMRFLLFASVVAQCACVIMLCLTQVAFPDLLDPNRSEDSVISITAYLTVGLGLSGVSKDLMKIQGKSVPKLCTRPGDDDRLFRVVSWLTGMKNSLKGAGYFLGSLLVWQAGWIVGLVINAGLALVLIPPALIWMENDLGVGKKGEKVSLDVFKKGWNVNVLSLARTFLFGSRDVWFEVAVPFFFRQILFWAPLSVGMFFATYTIIYGQLQSATTQMFNPKRKQSQQHRSCGCENGAKCGKCGYDRNPDRTDVPRWALITGAEALVLGTANYFAYQNMLASGNSNAVTSVLCLGIAAFAVVFAVNSAIHSYLIVLYSNKDKVSIDVGFYYMGNSVGRLFGTLLGGFVYTYTVEQFGLSVCLWISSALLGMSAVTACFLREHRHDPPTTTDVELPNGNSGSSMGNINKNDDSEGKDGKIHITEVPLITSLSNEGEIQLV